MADDLLKVWITSCEHLSLALVSLHHIYVHVEVAHMYACMDVRCAISLSSTNYNVNLNPFVSQTPLFYFFKRDLN